MKLTDMFSLKGKVALVTGGGRGIGKFIATGLAEAGADIILTSRKLKNLEATAAELEANQKVKAAAIACDMAKEDTVEAMLKEAVAKFGHIDILVNNAGATWGAPTLDFPLEKWDQLFNVNVRGVWVLTQKVARIMKEQGEATSSIFLPSCHSVVHSKKPIRLFPTTPPRRQSIF